MSLLLTASAHCTACPTVLQTSVNYSCKRLHTLLRRAMASWNLQCFSENWDSWETRGDSIKWMWRQQRCGVCNGAGARVGGGAAGQRRLKVQAPSRHPPLGNVQCQLAGNRLGAGCPRRLTWPPPSPCP